MSPSVSKARSETLIKKKLNVSEGKLVPGGVSETESTRRPNPTAEIYSTGMFWNSLKYGQIRNIKLVNIFANILNNCVTEKFK